MEFDTTRHGLDVIALAIPDAGIPSSMSAVADLVRDILARLRSGDDVVVHCRGGLGRTGLIAACVLTTTGHDARQAMAMVRAARHGAIENTRQEEFVRAFASTRAREEEHG
jgi:protein-tyrosine phosphatase